MANGFRRTKMTESPRKNIFEMNRSLFTGFTFFLPFPVRGTSVHISLTLKKQMKLVWISPTLKKYRFKTLFTFPRPCCSVDRMLLPDPTVFYCCGSWSAPECYFSLIVLILIVDQCWILPLLGAPILRGSIRILVLSKPWKAHRISMKWG